MDLKSGIDASVVTVEGLCKTYRVGLLRRKMDALRDVSFCVPRGTVFGILGSNGSGKTTLLKIITGLVRPTRGTFCLFGAPLNASAKARLGFLPDRPTHYPFLTARETLGVAAELFGCTGSQKKQRIEEVLSLVQLRERGGLRLKYYSKGMLQRLSLAQALLNDPDLLVLDEPVSALDPWGIRLMQQIFNDMKSAGKTVIFSSHLLNYAQEICEGFVILHQGRVAGKGTLPQSGSLEELFLGAVPSQEGG